MCNGIEPMSKSIIVESQGSYLERRDIIWNRGGKKSRIGMD